MTDIKIILVFEFATKNNGKIVEFRDWPCRADHATSHIKVFSGTWVLAFELMMLGVVTTNCLTNEMTKLMILIIPHLSLVDFLFPGYVQNVHKEGNQMFLVHCVEPINVIGGQSAKKSQQKSHTNTLNFSLWLLSVAE